jgi:hypothetical protein
MRKEARIPKVAPTHPLHDTVARLRKTRMEFEEADNHLGYEDGYAWAMDRADYPELMACLDKIRDHGGRGDSWKYFCPPDNAKENLAVHQENSERKVLDAAYWEGWAVGVQELHDQVEELI